MAFQFNTANIEIDGVSAIVISTIQPDKNDDYYVRLIQIYNQPPNSIPAPTPILTLTLKGGSQSISDQTELAVQIPPISSD